MLEFELVHLPDCKYFPCMGIKIFEEDSFINSQEYKIKEFFTKGNLPDIPNKIAVKIFEELMSLLDKHAKNMDIYEVFTFLEENFNRLYKYAL